MKKVLDKITREVYRLLHPILWKKRLQINGIPSITNFKKLKIGKDVSINRDVYIQTSGGGVTLGDRVTLSKGCFILTEGLDTNNYIENAHKRYRDHVSKNVVIGDGTWIAAGVIVCPGVSIASNSIVAAGSVVVEDLTEDGVLYGGIPAKKIRDILK